jgi:stage III sporulation protein AF
MQEILNLVQSIVIFRLLEQIILHLLPGKAYEKYVRFYLGLLLVLLLLQPWFQIFHLTEVMDGNALNQRIEQEVEALR